MNPVEGYGHVAARLTELGFSVYEARTYVGLLRDGPATGYVIAKHTGVPSPKVYETLRRLVAQGAAVQTGQRPARYAAVAVDRLLGSLERTFQDRLEAARRDLRTVATSSGSDEPMVMWRIHSLAAALGRAVEALDQARRRVYLSGRAPELKHLSDAVAAASSRGVEFVVVHFGRLPFPRPNGRTFLHGSTQGGPYSARESRHLVLATEASAALWAVARDGVHWQGLYGVDEHFAAAVKAFIRHDVYVQRLYADGRATLERQYGPGLVQLADLSPLAEQEHDVTARPAVG